MQKVQKPLLHLLHIDSAEWSGPWPHRPPYVTGPPHPRGKPAHLGLAGTQQIVTCAREPARIEFSESGSVIIYASKAPGDAGQILVRYTVTPCDGRVDRVPLST
jgi:hypothetical protein